MKVFIFLIVLLCAIGCNRKVTDVPMQSETPQVVEDVQDYLIQGQWENFKDSQKVYLISAYNDMAIDSTYVVNKTYTFSGQGLEMNRYTIQTEDRNYMYVWMANEEAKFIHNPDNFFEIKFEKRPEQDTLFRKMYYDITKLKNLQGISADDFANGIITQEEHSKKWKSLQDKKDTIKLHRTFKLPHDRDNFYFISTNKHTLAKKDLKKALDIFTPIYQDTESEELDLIKTAFEYRADIGVGKQVPNVELLNRSGEPIWLYDVLDNKPALIMFGGSWCGWCYSEYVNIRRGGKFENFHLVLIYQDEIDADTGTSDHFLEGINYTLLFAPSNTKHKSSITYGVNGAPEFFLVDKNQILVAEQKEIRKGPDGLQFDIIRPFFE